MNNYWLVGASWKGVRKDKEFVEKGIWMMGWDKKDQPAQYKRTGKLKTGDRIAIKKMRGRKGGLKILHIGIIKGIVLENDRVICTVDWLATDLGRDIEDSHGALASIHGPYTYDEDKWIQEIFCL